MEKEFLLLIFACSFKIYPSFAESGDCANLENDPDRNLIHEKSLGVDPCGVSGHIFTTCTTTEDGCTTETKDPSTATFQLIVQEYNYTAKMVKFRPSAGNGTFDPNSSKLGHFEDLVFPQCNSFACCESEQTNVARRCKDSKDAPTKAAFNKNFYSIAYAWYPDEGYKGPVLFVVASSQSTSQHWENVISGPIYVAVPPPPSKPPPKLTTVMTTEFLSSTTSSTPTSHPPTIPISRPLTTESVTTSPTPVGIIISTSTMPLTTPTTEIIPTTASTTTTTTKRSPTTKRKTTPPVLPKKANTLPTTHATTTKKLTKVTTKKPTTTHKTTPPTPTSTQETTLETSTLETSTVFGSSSSPSTTAETPKPHQRPPLVLTPHRARSKIHHFVGPALLRPPKVSPKRPKGEMMKPPSSPEKDAPLRHPTHDYSERPNSYEMYHPPMSNWYSHSGHPFNQAKERPDPSSSFHHFVSSGGTRFQNGRGFVLEASPYSATIYQT